MLLSQTTAQHARALALQQWPSRLQTGNVVSG